MESIGCEDLDVIVGAGYAAARAALSAQEEGARVLATTPPYRRHLPHSHIARRIWVRQRVMTERGDVDRKVRAATALTSQNLRGSGGKGGCGAGGVANGPQLKQNSAKVVGATHAPDIIDARRN